MEKADLILSLQKRRNNEPDDDAAPKIESFKDLQKFSSFSLSFFFGENDQEPRCDNEGCIFFQCRSGMIEFPSENDEASGKNSVERRERETNEK